MGDRYAHLRLDDAERMLAARVEDLARAADGRGIARFSAFLDRRQREIAACALSAAVRPHRFFGGHDDAERMILGVAPDGPPAKEDFPLAPITVRYRSEEGLTHRDLLGALMAMKVKREAVGDILVGDTFAVVFVLEPVVWPILQEMERVGRAGVICEAGRPDVLPAAKVTEERRGVVSSLRLDCVTALLANVDRASAQRLVRSGLTQVNARAVDNPSREIAQGDILSIRGHGRFLLAQVRGRTKKNRIHITFEKYI